MTLFDMIAEAFFLTIMVIMLISLLYKILKCFCDYLGLHMQEFSIIFTIASLFAYGFYVFCTNLDKLLALFK